MCRIPSYKVCPCRAFLEVAKVHQDLVLLATSSQWLTAVRVVSTKIKKGRETHTRPTFLIRKQAC